MPIHTAALTMFAIISACGGSATPSAPITSPAVSKPDARADHVMVYDEARRVTFLFGGGGAAMYGDSWTWNGTTWTRVATTGPSPRNVAALVYDARRQRVVLFGGQVGPTLLRDTWEWDGTSWTQRSTTGPDPRIHHAAAFDAQRGKVVLYGGFGTSDEVLGDTWEWDGATWTRVSTTGIDRWVDAIAFDQQRNQLVMLATERISGPNRTNRTDLWSWSGTVWTPLGTPFSGPQLSPVQPMVTLGASGGVLVFDGGTAQGAASTWTWNGAWTKAASTGPSVRNGAALAYDSDRRRVVLFGGGTSTANFGDTWEWDGQRWTQVGTP